MGRLDGKVAIVTGGASGMGKATSELFAKEGAKVVITDIQESEGIEVATKIKNEGYEAIFIKLNITSERDWENVFNRTLSFYGKVNVLVNNAGTLLQADIEETTLSEWNKVMDINATGVFLGTKYAIQAMKVNDEKCSIINRSSIDGIFAESRLFAYCASKGAVTVLTKSAALTCGEKGYKIRVNSVHPGVIHTPMVDAGIKKYGLEIEDYIKKTSANIPIGHLGEPKDIAYMDLYLASDESKFVTGASFIVDGGFTAK